MDLFSSVHSTWLRRWQPAARRHSNTSLGIQFFFNNRAKKKHNFLFILDAQFQQAQPSRRTLSPSAVRRFIFKHTVQILKACSCHSCSWTIHHRVTGLHPASPNVLPRYNLSFENSFPADN